MEKEVQSSTQDSTIRELSVLADPSNEQSTKIKQNIRILDHPNNLIEVIRARLAIEKGIAGNAIITGPNHYLPRWGSTVHLPLEVDRAFSGNCE